MKCSIAGGAFFLQFISALLLLTGTANPEWGVVRTKHRTEENLHSQMAQAYGLWTWSLIPSCLTEECKAAREESGLSLQADPCKEYLRNAYGGDEQGCIFNEGSKECVCPLPKRLNLLVWANSTLDTACSTMTAEHGDTLAATGLEWGEVVAGKLESAQVPLVIAVIAQCTACMTVGFGMSFPVPQAVGLALGIVGDLLAILTGFVGVSGGSGFVAAQATTSTCGSMTRWDLSNDDRQKGDQLEIDSFATGARLVVAGVVFGLAALVPLALAVRPLLKKRTASVVSISPKKHTRLK